MSETKTLQERLRMMADEMRREGQNGWPVTADLVADAIDAKDALLREAAEVIDRLLRPVAPFSASAIEENGAVVGHARNLLTKLTEAQKPEAAVEALKSPKQLAETLFRNVSEDGWSSEMVEEFISEFHLVSDPIIAAWNRLPHMPDRGYAEGVRAAAEKARLWITATDDPCMGRCLELAAAIHALSQEDEIEAAIIGYRNRGVADPRLTLDERMKKGVSDFAAILSADHKTAAPPAPADTTNDTVSEASK